MQFGNVFNKRLLVGLSALTLFWEVAVCTGADYRTLLVSCHDGSDIRFTLTSKLTLSFTTDALQVKDESVNVDVPRSVLAGFNVSDVEAGIDCPVVNAAVGAPVITALGVSFGSFEGRLRVEIHMPDGKLLRTCEIGSGDILPYSDFARGVNILTVGGSSFKIHIK